MSHSPLTTHQPPSQDKDTLHPTHARPKKDLISLTTTTASLSITTSPSTSGHTDNHPLLPTPRTASQYHKLTHPRHRACESNAERVHVRCPEAWRHLGSFLLSWGTGDEGRKVVRGEARGMGTKRFCMVQMMKGTWLCNGGRTSFESEYWRV